MRMTTFKIKKEQNEDDKSITLELMELKLIQRERDFICLCGTCPKKIISLVGTDNNGLRKTLVSFDEEGRMILHSFASLDGLKTDDSGHIEVMKDTAGMEKLKKEPETQPSTSKNPSINGVEFWLEKDNDGDIVIRAKNKDGQNTMIGWFHARVRGEKIGIHLTNYFMNTSMAEFSITDNSITHI